jgi:hypothetical protein
MDVTQSVSVSQLPSSVVLNSFWVKNFFQNLVKHIELFLQKNGFTLIYACQRMFS